jgi:predicted metalloprotease with PDZ domain
MSPNRPEISYHVQVDSLAGHLFSVEVEIDNPSPTGQRLTLPAWIPGSYMIRDFAKNIISFSAWTENEEVLNFVKTDKQTWQLSPSKGKVKVKYQVYAFDLSVRSTYIDDEFAFFNGTSLFLMVEGQTERAVSVELKKPSFAACAQWQVASTLNLAQGTKSHDFGHFQAENYAELIDHPVLMGKYDVVPFSTNGVSFELILAGGHQSDTQRMANDLQKICEHHILLFADVPPIERYLFITMLTGNGFGGLEHCSSTALLFSRDNLPSKSQKNSVPDGYRDFLGLCSHEFFHTWHVKRIKPEELFGAQLNAECYTEQLWIYEGFTSYYDDLSLQRCGVISDQSYLELFGQNLTRLKRNHGRFKQTVTESSFDAWTKFYQQDASAINNIVSYYNKGAVIALCLDLLIRQESNHSLDDVMRLLWQKHGKLNLPTQKNTIQQLLKKHLSLEFDDFFKQALYSNTELPADKLLKSIGIECKYRARDSSKDLGGKPANDVYHNDFGAAVTKLETGARVAQVRENTAAYIAGLQVGDQLLAVGNWQVKADTLQTMIDRYDAGQTLTLHILRHEQLKTLQFHVQTAPLDTIYLEIIEPEKSSNWLYCVTPATVKQEQQLT